MRYLCLLTGDPVDPEVPPPAPGSPEFAQMLEAYQAATTAMSEAGVLVDSAPLQDPLTARTLRLRNGEPMVTDGPFMEIKEVIGGYYVLNCPDFDEALRWVATIPAARYGAIEVRPVMEMGGPT